MTWANIAVVAISAIMSLSPLLVPAVAGAQAGSVGQYVTNCPQDTGIRCNGGTISEIFHTIINWAMAIAFIAAVIMLIWGGFRYITSAGNDEQAKSGRGTIVNALIGMVIIVLSYVIVQIVYKFVTGT